jgi:peptidoglycan/xylan/chitin deacetylase (PgdA/CDA1 family)
VKKTLLKIIYNFGGFAPFHWTNRGKILILMYHRFSRESNPYKISAREFTAHLEYLSKRSRVLPLSEIIDCLKNETPLPPNAAVITIDDGYADVYDVAFPLLKKFEMPATLFAVTDFIDGKCWLWTDLMRYVLLDTKAESLNIEFADGEKIEAKLTGENGKEKDRLEIAGRVNSKLKRLPDEEKEAKIKEISAYLNVKIPVLPTPEYAPISWEQAREMDAGNLKIESHTVTHPILTNINQARLDYELQTSKSRLESVLGRKVEHFCYPNGNLNSDVRKSVEKAGYESAVTTDYGFNGKQTNQFALNRIDAPSPIEKFAQSASGFESFTRKIRN